MNKKRILTSLFFLIVCSSFSLSGYAGESLNVTANTNAATPDNVTAVIPTSDSPKIVVPEMTYIFPDTLENTKVTHDYVIQNKGTAMLDIINVKPG